MNQKEAREWLTSESLAPDVDVEEYERAFDWLWANIEAYMANDGSFVNPSGCLEALTGVMGTDTCLSQAQLGDLMLGVHDLKAAE